MPVILHASLRHLVRGLVLVAVLGAGAAFGATGCTTEDCTEPNAAGDCVQTCDPAACAPNHACVANDCRPACSGQEDCPVGFNCVTVFVNGTEQTGDYCFQLEYAAGGSTGQEGTACSSDDACDTLRGWSCIDATCKRACRSHADCALGHCAPTAGGHYCVSDTADHAPGRYGTACPNRDADCDAAAGFVCSSDREADPDNFCTKSGCATDADCAVGLYCADLGTSGTRCLARDYCRPCETDVDCLGVPDAICARDASGARICTRTCDVAERGACPWGSASLCALTDTELGVPTCSHKFGSCTGSGGACEPCSQHADCGADNYCLELPATGERACVDLGFDCASSDDCPLSPGGVKTECTIGAGVPTDYIFYAKCTPPNVSRSLQGTMFGCWPE